MMPPRHSISAALAAIALIASGLATPEQAARAIEPVVVTFSSHGQYVFEVPAGVSTIHVVLVGGRGGGEGGFGHRVEGTLEVEPGATLHARVGGNGDFDGAGFNGGSRGGSGFIEGHDGGGASDIRTADPDGPDDQRLMVAGGGGGSAYESRGGDAGEAGENGLGGGGQPGTESAGGGGGDPDSGAAGGGPAARAGGAGFLGHGGMGGDGTIPYGAGGGGGGGGYYGGGGGGGSSYTLTTDEPRSAGGGGGGSSYTGNATSTSVTTDTTGTPMIAITYTPSADTNSGALAGTITAASEPGGPCLIVGGSTIDFGTHSFNAGSAPPVVGTIDDGEQNSFDIENCGDDSVELLARGTSATSRTSDAAWDLLPIGGSGTTCTVAGPDTSNVYGLVNEGDGTGSQSLSTSDTTVNPSLAAGDTRSHQLFIQMPCVGSDGAGETFDLTVTYTAIEP